jgi:hypothetical protein
MDDDRSTSSEPYPETPDFYFGVKVPPYFKDDWAREPGHAFRMGVLNTLSMVAEFHDISQLQDDWRHMCETDGQRRTAWLRGEF